MLAPHATRDAAGQCRLLLAGASPYWMIGGATSGAALFPAPLSIGTSVRLDQTPVRSTDPVRPASGLGPATGDELGTVANQNAAPHGRSSARAVRLTDDRYLEGRPLRDER